jgi:hypothetical protein
MSGNYWAPQTGASRRLMPTIDGGSQSSGSAYMSGADCTDVTPYVTITWAGLPLRRRTGQFTNGSRSDAMGGYLGLVQRSLKTEALLLD